MKRRSIFTLLLASFLACSCGGGEKVLDPITIDSIGFLTGLKSTTDTLTNWALGGTDLGIPVYDDTENKMYFLFGDSYLGSSDYNTIRTQQWRSNVIGITKDFDAKDGIIFDSFINRGRPFAAECLPGKHMADGTGEVTKIPTGGIFINGTLYIFFFSINAWGASGVYDISYCGVAKSTDKGQSFTYMPDLIWSTFNNELTSSLIKEDFGVDMSISELESRNAPLFRQIFPKNGNDGYIYIYGVGGGRYEPSQMGRVKVENFEQFDEYEYLIGYAEDSSPIWKKGKEGLAELAKENHFVMIDDLVSEPCVVYNAYLGKWIYQYESYANRGKINLPQIMRFSDTPYGPWSEPLVYSSKIGAYGGFLHEKYMENNGETMYIFMSDWNEYNVVIETIHFNEK